MEVTLNLKRRFVKDTNLPIKVFDEPYFSHFLKLYDEQFQAMKKWKEFLELLTCFETEQEYFEVYNRVKDAAITYLAENPAMQYFCQIEDMAKFKIQNVGLPGNSIYKETNIGKFFVSIDMRKANFTALREYNPEIVGNTNSYEDFIGMFTDCEYFKKSKYIRQVIFGNQNPKRQTTYEKYLMDQVLTKILEELPVTSTDVAYFGTDEIVLDVSAFVKTGMVDIHFGSKMADVLAWAEEKNIMLRAEYFLLYRVDGTEGYMKDFVYPTCLNKDVEIKGVDSISMPFVIRFLKGETPQEEDCVFFYEGRMAKLLSPIEISLRSS